MAVNETLRQAYLQQLGIQSYFPRRALPGAKPSPFYADGVLRIPDASVRAATTSRQMLTTLAMETPARLAIELPLVASAPQARVAVAREIAAPENAAPEIAGPEINSKEALRFAFAYFPINEDLAVINELPWAKSAAVSATCRQLLAAILKALSIPCEEKTLSSMVFTWPMFEGANIEHSPESARHALRGFLGKRLQLRPVRHLLVLAEQSAGLLFPEDFDWQAAGMVTHPRFELQTVVTRSLNAMDAVPEIKRSVWQALQPLRLALTAPVSGQQ